MKLPAPVPFHWLLQSLAGARVQLRVLETLCFKLGSTESCAGGETDGPLRFEFLPEKANLSEVLHQLLSRHHRSTFVLYRCGADYFVKTLGDLIVMVERKDVPVDMLQILPSQYQHKRIHVLDLKFKGTVYQSNYSMLLRSGRTVEGTSERCFRKLKSEVSRIVQMTETCTGMRVVGGRFAFLICEGVTVLQNVEECILIPSHLLPVYTERVSDIGGLSKSMSNRLRTNRELVSGTRSLLASPLRIRTPALASPTSRRPTAETKSPRLPSVVSPSRAFNPNFRELLAKTMERAQLRAMTFYRRAPALTEEIVRDDNRFFEFVGLKNTLKPSQSDIALSPVSTNESISREMQEDKTS